MARPARSILTSPDGKRFSHDDAERLRTLTHIVVLCGRYEGVDERVRASLATEELSIGDYVLSGGELPALVIVDAVARLVPGVVGDEQSVARDTFARGGLLDFPQYTRPGGLSRHDGVRRSCSRGIMRRSSGGAGARRWRARSSGGRTCWTRRASTRRTGRCWMSCAAGTERKRVKAARRGAGDPADQ